MDMNKASGFVSPFREIHHIGDPFMLYDDATKKFYLYCTGGKYRCFSSDDMTEWQEHGDSYLVTEKSFGTESYWAPEVYKVGDTFYMVYSAARTVDGKKRHSIGLASSKCPTGPFTDVYDHPLFAPDYSVIDASLLFDDDGKVYLYYSRDCSENYVDGKRTSQTFGIELAPDLSGTVGESVLLATPVSPWEQKSGSVLWNEGPCCFKRNGVYYLLFTANYYASVHYCVGYATGNSPLGPFTKAKENPILVGDGVYTSGTGHCNVVYSPDKSEMYMVYHSHYDVTNTTNPIADITPCVDKIVFDKDGKMSVNGPSVAKQPFLSGVNGLCKKYEGVKVTSDLKTVSGDIDSLTNGATVTDTPYVFAGEGSVRLDFDAPITAESIWIYGEKTAERAPRSVYAVVNGTHTTEKVTFGDEKPYTPAVIVLDMQEVKSVELRFDGGDEAAISEIVTVEKK